MSYIGSKPATSFVGLSSQSFTGGSGTSFTLNKSVSSTSDIAVFVNNVRQNPTNSSYSVSGTTLTMSASIASSDIFYVVFLGATTGTVNPQAGSVGSSQITSEMITGLPALSTAPADTDEFMVSDAGVLKRIDASLVVGGGKILQVVQAFKTDTFSSSSSSYVDITGMTLSITPASSSNKILLRVVMQHGGNDNMYGGIKVLRDSTHIGQSTAVSLGSQVNASFAFNTPHSANGSSKVYSSGFELLDTPSTTSAITYKLQVFTRDGEAFNLNRPNNNSNGAFIIGGTSSMTAQEVSA